MQDNPDITSELVRELIQEKRSARRWKNLRFFITCIIIVSLVGLMGYQGSSTVSLGAEGKGYVALVRLDGMIAPGENFSAATVVPLLKDAFSDKEAKGVVLDINSGGGTPVQAAIMHDAILELKRQYHKKVIVVGEDMLASGAYYIAVAADKIYVNPNTITGSIGVVMKEFGFPEAIKKIGIERRVYASGSNKDRLDPFLPQNPVDVEKIRHVIGEIHANFQQIVQQGRGGKLQGNPAELFSGDFWSGQTALKLGLVDGLGNLMNVLRDEFNVAEFKDYSGQLPLLKNLLNQVGASLQLMLQNDQVRVLEKI